MTRSEMRTCTIIPGLLLGAALGLVARPAHAQLSVRSSGTDLIVTSDHTPSWKITFSKSSGAAVDLRVPKSGGTDLISGNSWSDALLPWLAYMEDGTFKHTYRHWKNRASRFEVLEQSAQRVVVAVEGGAESGHYKYKQRLTIVPTGLRNDLEIVSKEPAVGIGTYFWFKGNVLNGKPVTLWDQDTAPIQITGRGVDEPVSLPPRIDYPFELRIPHQTVGDVSFRFTARNVPAAIKDRREWSQPANFGPRFGWTWLAFVAGDDPHRTAPREIVPAGVPQSLSFSFQITTASGDVAPISGVDSSR